MAFQNDTFQVASFQTEGGVANTTGGTSLSGGANYSGSD